MPITDADPAEALRVALADICGFWHKSGDDGLLCRALAQHRIQAELRLAEKLAALTIGGSTPHAALELARPRRRPSRPRRLAAPLRAERSLD
jgi:hypothetical protein